MQQAIVERIGKARDQLKQWGQERRSELDARRVRIQERGEALKKRGDELLEDGRVQVRQAEATALGAARDLLARASEGLGERGTFLKRGIDALDEALVALRAGQQATLPIAGFDGLSVKDATARLEGLDAVALRTLRAYEAGHKNRVTLLREIDARLGAEAPAPVEPAAPQPAAN